MSTAIPHGKVEGSVVPVHVMKVYRGVEVELRSFNISTSWRWVVYLSLWPLLPRYKALVPIA